MPLIPPYVLDCAIYLYRTIPDAQQGRRTGGSGFLAGVFADMGPRIGQLTHIYAVTNAHLIENNFPVVRLNLIAGGFDVIDFTASDWYLHPDGDDVAVCPLDLAWSDYKVHFIHEGFILPKDVTLSDRKLGPGDDTFMIGRFISKSGEQQNTPVARFGNISMMPIEPIPQLDRGGFPQESFLVETRSLAGFSGSPVFIYRTYIQEGKRRIGDADDYYLLGIDWGHLPAEWVELKEKDRKTPDYEKRGVWENSGFSQIVPSWKILELLNMRELVMKREQAAKDLAEQIANQSVGVAVMDSSSEESGVFSKTDFEQVLKKVSTRKASVDRETGAH